jgi:hypothetical protein
MAWYQFTARLFCATGLWSIFETAKTGGSPARSFPRGTPPTRAMHICITYHRWEFADTFHSNRKKETTFP